MGKVVWLRPQDAMLNTKDINLKNNIENYVKGDSFNSKDPCACAKHILLLTRNVFRNSERFPIFELSKILGFKVYRG